MRELNVFAQTNVGARLVLEVLDCGASLANHHASHVVWHQQRRAAATRTALIRTNARGVPDSSEWSEATKAASEATERGRAKENEREEKKQ